MTKFKSDEVYHILKIESIKFENAMRLKLIKIFGVMSFFVQAKRTAIIIAEGDVKVGMIARDTFILCGILWH